MFVLIIAFCSYEQIYAQSITSPDTMSVQSGDLILKALLWHPSGQGPFPTVIFCHGSYGGADTISNPEEQISILGPVFERNGYIFLGLFRRGVGLSKEQGVNSSELMNNAFIEKGIEGRNKVQLQHLETDQLYDMISGINFLIKRKEVDTNCLAIVGHSFGGSLTLLVAAHDHRLKSVVIFGAAGYSWDSSPQLRASLISAVKYIDAPIMIIHAENDYSTNPGYQLDSILNVLHKPHLLKIYPRFKSSASEGHNLIFLSPQTWESDVIKFLNINLRN
jgi:dienelactone hydrolase